MSILEHLGVFALVIGTLFVVWLPVLWGRYQASLASLLSPWRFALVSGSIAHGISLLLFSLIATPFEYYVALTIEPESILHDVAGAFNIILSVIAALFVPRFLIPSWRKLYGN